MPDPLTSYIDTWQSQYQTVGSDLWQLGNALKGAATYINAQNWYFAYLYLDAAGDAAHDVSRGFSVDAGSMYFVMYDALHWIDDNIGDGGEVTMDAILTAMWDTDKLRSFHFINYIDAMRAGIWNTEIYETHLQDWYRHFSL